MLTKDLVRVQVRGRELVPTLIDPARDELVSFATDLVALAERAVAESLTRGAVEDEIDERIGPSKHQLVLRGLAKLLLDRCDAEVDPALDPPALRERVFLRARERGPLALDPDDALGRVHADAVLAEVGAEVGLSADALRRALYADLPSEQVVRSWRPLSPQALLHRYNVAQIQALLLHTTEVRLFLPKPSVARVRQLLRHAKFQQLLFRASRRDDGLELVLDGPMSLFSQSTRYGMQLANFLPAVILQDGAWTLEADVRWVRGGAGATAAKKSLKVGPELGLISHLADTGAYVAREVSWFVERWNASATDSGWRMSEVPEPIDLGGRGVVLPDFTFERDGRTAHLEIVGYWRKDWLARRLEGLRRHAAGNLVLAVSTKLCGDDGVLDDLPVQVIPFAQVVPVKDVLAALDKVAR